MLSELSSWLGGGSKKKASERRLESRLPGHGVVQIRWADAAGEIRTIETHLINVSTKGFEVRAPHDLDVGTEIEILDPSGQTANAVVLHSRPDFGEFLVGGTAEWNRGAKASE